jgi:hypothetical protein
VTINGVASIALNVLRKLPIGKKLAAWWRYWLGTECLLL